MGGLVASRQGPLRYRTRRLPTDEDALNTLVSRWPSRTAEELRRISDGVASPAEALAMRTKPRILRTKAASSSDTSLKKVTPTPPCLSPPQP